MLVDYYVIPFGPMESFYLNGFPISRHSAELLAECGVRKWWLDIDLPTNTNRWEGNAKLLANFRFGNFVIVDANLHYRRSNWFLK